MQGTAADIVKRAMIAVDQYTSATALDVGVIMQVHDELVLEVGEGDVETVASKCRHACAVPRAWPWSWRWT